MVEAVFGVTVLATRLCEGYREVTDFGTGKVLATAKVTDVPYFPPLVSRSVHILGLTYKLGKLPNSCRSARS
jgi:hypothetical protein